MVSIGVSRATQRQMRPRPKWSERIFGRFRPRASQAWPRNSATSPAYTVGSKGQPTTSRSGAEDRNTTTDVSEPSTSEHAEGHVRGDAVVGPVDDLADLQ